ncbi:hypothetical protein Syun_027853 [Stephania yunnanensis]|uniref:Uncharacterized protein n=1 Tax=Stephania yunnanensis TaxID=152371 RepID=A0AAP0ELG3_9MAGN
MSSSMLDVLRFLPIPLGLLQSLDYRARPRRRTTDTFAQAVTHRELRTSSIEEDILSILSSSATAVFDFFFFIFFIATPLLPLHPITVPEKRYQENQLREIFNADRIVFDFFFFIFFISSSS